MVNTEHSILIPIYPFPSGHPPYTQWTLFDWGKKKDTPKEHEVGQVLSQALRGAGGHVTEQAAGHVMGLL